MNEKDLTQLTSRIETDLCLSKVSDNYVAAPNARKLDDEEFERAGRVISDYLIANVPEFARLSALRQKGWENPAGDEFFRKQRERADNADATKAKGFYRMMKNVGRSLHHDTQAYRIRSPGAGQKQILDMCMAPGGFLATALEQNRDARALGFSLPPSRGGHDSFLPPSPNVELRLLDVTMLAEDMGVTDIPADHPDADNFLPRQLHPQDGFQLVFCDGHVLRTHEGFRAGYREHVEARRLCATQLALGLEHLCPGGTMVVLLHKVDSWHAALVLREFSRFSRVRLFKHKKIHAKRSSFYVVASDVRSESAEASAAVAAWKEVWRRATFDVDDEERTRWSQQEPDPRDVLDDFGGELVRLGREVWKVQADALEQASFTQDHRN